ncbi:hypothetical protein H5410_006041 [Solanum commersonii]|uniref:Uncharacterized protein n=1 Tax=Solanum commersonii TaxID=4109 RepID=A0A9J6AA31_SOLCO|nr:hypothetical protein H5410_006041 [Solanum commersonii]
MCTLEPGFNMVIVTTFERRASVRLSSWLKKARDTDQCPNKFKAMSEQVKKARDSFKGGLLNNGGAKSVGTITRKMDEHHKYVNENLDSSVQMTLELSTQIWIEKVVGGHTRVYSIVEALEMILKGVGSSRQVETIDDVQIAAMSAQIAKLTAVLKESERKKSS